MATIRHVVFHEVDF